MGLGGPQEPGPAFLFQAVALSFDVDGGGVVEQPVEDGAGDDGVAEDVAPGAEALVAGERDGAPFVAAGDELEEEVCALAVDGDVADLVDDQELSGGVARFPRPIARRRDRGSSGGFVPIFVQKKAVSGRRWSGHFRANIQHFNELRSDPQLLKRPPEPKITGSNPALRPRIAFARGVGR